mmetsp:Transcript_93013/g.259144  ORF Transcript_93013/g.259144 Transcript_93013/m.259144 type:complete len:297 (+) Transcript_93013:954-1844(+)
MSHACRRRTPFHRKPAARTWPGAAMSCHCRTFACNSSTVSTHPTGNQLGSPLCYKGWSHCRSRRTAAHRRQPPRCGPGSSWTRPRRRSWSSSSTPPTRSTGSPRHSPPDGSHSPRTNRRCKPPRPRPLGPRLCAGAQSPLHRRRPNNSTNWSTHSTRNPRGTTWSCKRPPLWTTRCKACLRVEPWWRSEFSSWRPLRMSSSKPTSFPTLQTGSPLGKGSCRRHRQPTRCPRTLPLRAPRPRGCRASVCAPRHRKTSSMRTTGPSFPTGKPWGRGPHCKRHSPGPCLGRPSRRRPPP